MGILLVLLISAFLRLSSLDLMEFKADQALTVLQLRDFLAHPYLMSSGLISSLGIPNFPLFNYLLLPFAFISTDPKFLTAVIAGLNIIAIASFYIIIKKLFDQKIAILAALLLATSPWAVLFSRSIWAQNLILIFLVPLLFFCFKKNYLATGIFLALLIQLHLSGLFLLIPLFSFNRKFFLGLALGMIPAIPYFVHIQLPITGQSPWDLNNLFRPFQILGSGFFEFVTGEKILSPAYLIVIPLLISLKTRFFAKIILGVTFLYFVLKVPSYMHYYIILLPFLALAAALGIKALGKVGYAILTITVISNLIFLAHFFNLISTKNIIPGDYGPTYSYMKSLIDKQSTDENLKLLAFALPPDKITPSIWPILNQQLPLVLSQISSRK